MNCNLNVFWRLCQKLLRLQARSFLKLHSYLKTTQWYTANHFRTVPLDIVFWILLYVKTLWITGLKFWVICDIKFDLVVLWPARTYLRTRTTSLSFPPLTCWIVNSASSGTVLTVFRSANYSRRSSFFYHQMASSSEWDSVISAAGERWRSHFP